MSVSRRRDKYFNTSECHTAVKMNEPEPPTSAGANLRNLIMGKISRLKEICKTLLT